MRIRAVAAALALAAPLLLRAETPNPSGRTTADVLAQLETFARSAMAEEKVPGMAYAVVKDGEVVFAKGYGKRSVTDASDTVTVDTLFEIGSTSKAFTAALVAMEVDAGRIAWDDRVVSHLPDFRLYDPWVTAEFRVCDLLSQRSGMPGQSLTSMGVLGFSRAEIERAMAFVEPTFGFRGGFGYVNTLWLTAARLVEKCEGTTWEEALATRIFQPLSMRDSTVDPELVKLVADRASGHYRDRDGTMKVVPEDWPFRDWLDIFGPAGNIRSTVGDMSRWAAFHLAHGKAGSATLLKSATADALHAPRTFVANPPPSGSSPKATAYALGWVNEEFGAGTLVWHNGGTTGQHSIIALYEWPNVALVVLTNVSANMVPERMRLRLFDLLHVPAGAAALTSDPAPADAAIRLDAPPRPAARPAPLAPVPPLGLERYAGTYENPAYGRFVVKLEGGALRVVMGPRPTEGTLEPWSGNTFVMHGPFGLPPEDLIFTFTVPPGGNATRFVSSAFADVRGGAFTRVP